MRMLLKAQDVHVTMVYLSLNALSSLQCVINVNDVCHNGHSYCQNELE